MGDDLDAKLAALERLQEMPYRRHKLLGPRPVATLKRQRRQIKDAVASTRELVSAAHRLLREK